MDTVLNIGLITIELLGIVFLIINTIFIIALTAMAIKVHKFAKKQKALFDVLGSFTTLLNQFKKKENTID